MTPASIKSKSSSLLSRCGMEQRVESAIIFLVIFALFGFFYCLAAGIINAESLFGKCGFKQHYNLPCPTCGFTTAITAFMRGEILSAFYIQPAVGLMCVLLVVLAVLSLLTACLGVKFRFLPPVRQWRISYIIVAVLIVFAFGWLVTLIQA
jgi:hypothetical protein